MSITSIVRTITALRRVARRLIASVCATRLLITSVCATRRLIASICATRRLIASVCATRLLITSVCATRRLIASVCATRRLIASVRTLVTVMTSVPPAAATSIVAISSSFALRTVTALCLTLRRFDAYRRWILGIGFRCRCRFARLSGQYIRWCCGATVVDTVGGVLLRHASCALRFLGRDSFGCFSGEIGNDRRFIGNSVDCYLPSTTLRLLRRRLCDGCCCYGLDSGYGCYGLDSGYGCYGLDSGYGCYGLDSGYGCGGLGRLPRPTLRRHWHRCSVLLQWFFRSRCDRGVCDGFLRSTALLRCYRLFFYGLCFSCWH
jgi:hypothetical protein